MWKDNRQRKCYKSVETQNTSKKEINRKRQLRELGKEKYLPLILTIVCIIVECIMYTVYAMREVPTIIVKCRTCNYEWF